MGFIDNWNIPTPRPGGFIGGIPRPPRPSAFMARILAMGCQGLRSRKAILQSKLNDLQAAGTNRNWIMELQRKLNYIDQQLSIKNCLGPTPVPPPTGGFISGLPNPGGIMTKRFKRCRKKCEEMARVARFASPQAKNRWMANCIKECMSVSPRPSGFISGWNRPPKPPRPSGFISGGFGNLTANLKTFIGRVSTYSCDTLKSLLQRLERRLEKANDMPGGFIRGPIRTAAIKRVKTKMKIVQREIINRCVPKVGPPTIPGTGTTPLEPTRFAPTSPIGGPARPPTYGPNIIPQYQEY